MTSKGKQCQILKEEAVVKSGLPGDVIMNWIGNHRKTVHQMKYVNPKTLYERGMAGNNQFVHENKDEIGAMASWPESWQVFSESEKLQYKRGTREFQPECNKKKKGSAIAEKSWENAQGSSGSGNRLGLLWGGHNQPGLYNDRRGKDYKFYKINARPPK